MGGPSASAEVSERAVLDAAWAGADGVPGGAQRLPHLRLLLVLLLMAPCDIPPLSRDGQS
jgi:hypothetical protein